MFLSHLQYTRHGVDDLGAEEDRYVCYITSM